MCGVHLRHFQNAQKEKENDEIESSELSSYAWSHGKGGGWRERQYSMIHNLEPLNNGHTWDSVSLYPLVEKLSSFGV